MGKSCDQRQIREDEPCIGISSLTQGREKEEDSQETIMWCCKVGLPWPFFDAVPVFLSLCLFMEGIIITIIIVIFLLILCGSAKLSSPGQQTLP